MQRFEFVYRQNHAAQCPIILVLMYIGSIQLKLGKTSLMYCTCTAFIFKIVRIMVQKKVENVFNGLRGEAKV